MHDVVRSQQDLDNSALVDIAATLQDVLRAQIEQHMSECENCRVVVDTLQRTIDIICLANDGEALPSDVHQRLMARLQLFLTCRS